MLPVTLELRDDKNEIVGTVTAAFQPDDLTQFNQFVEAVQRLRNCALLQRGMPGIVNMEWTGEKGMKFTCAQYSDAELYELLHVLRPLILFKEATSFGKIAGLMGHRFSNKQFAQHLRALRSMFDHGELKAYMQISIGGQPLFDDSLIHTWLNGVQYHTDADKAKAWKEIEKSLSSDNARALVMNQLQSKVKAIFLLEHLVKLVLKRYAAT